MNNALNDIGRKYMQDGRGIFGNSGYLVVTNNPTPLIDEGRLMDHFGYKTSLAMEIKIHMSLISLFNRVEILSRNDGGSDYIDFEYIPKESYPVEVECNIQPYRDGKNNLKLPDGFRSVYAIEVRSPSELRASDELEGWLADEITYEGRTFYCLDIANWTGHSSNGSSLIPNHYLGLFYRRDKV